MFRSSLALSTAQTICWEVVGRLDKQNSHNNRPPVRTNEDVNFVLRASATELGVDWKVIPVDGVDDIQVRARTHIERKVKRFLRIILKGLEGGAMT